MLTDDIRMDIMQALESEDAMIRARAVFAIKVLQDNSAMHALNKLGLVERYFRLLLRKDASDMPLMDMLSLSE